MAKQFSVDRARFLAFAAAFASAASFQACSATDTAPGEDGGSAGMAQGGSSAAAGHAGNGEDSAGSAGSAGEGNLAGAGGVNGDGAGGQAGASEAGAAGAGMCDDSVGVATCSEVSSACSHYCNAALMNLKPAVADAAIGCLKLDATSNCDTGYSCLSDATAKGCPEDVVDECAVAIANCPEPDPAEPACKILLSGMNDAARAEAVSCFEEGCISVYSCAEGLFWE